MEEQPVRPDLKQIVYECRDLFSRLSERNRALSEEWDDFATRLEVRPDSPRREERGPYPRESDSLPQAKEFGDSLLNLHERFFETCREMLQVRLENDNLKKERASLQSELARFSEKVILLGRTQSELAEQKATYETQLKASKQILEETDRNLRRLEGQLAGRRGELETLSTNLDRVTHERDSAFAARNLLESRISEIENSRASLSDRVQTLEQRQEELRQQVGLLEDQLSRAKVRAEELELETMRGRARIADLESDLSFARERRSELERTLEQVRETTAPVEDFLSLKRGLLQIQEERVVQAQQEAYQIETIARLEKETQDLRATLQEAETARSHTESLRKQLQEELHNTQRETGQREQKLARPQEAQKPVITGPTPLTPSAAEFLAQEFEPEPSGLDAVAPADISLPFGDFTPAEAPPSPPASKQTPSRTEEPIEVSAKVKPLPPSIEASLFGFENEPPTLSSLAFQEDDRVFAELTETKEPPHDIPQELPSARSILDAALSKTPELLEELGGAASFLGGDGFEEVPDILPEVSSTEDIFPGAVAPSKTPTLDNGVEGRPLTQAGLQGEVSVPLFQGEKETPEIIPVVETSVADVLNQAFAKEGIEPTFQKVTPTIDSVSNILSRVLDETEPPVSLPSFEESLPVAEPVPTFEAGMPVIPPDIEVPVQPAPLLGEAPPIPPSPFQPAMDFPYPEITGVRMENFTGKRVLLVGGDERFQSDYAHLFTMVRADLLYFPSILQLEKQGMKRHVRECDLAVVFGRAVNEPGVLRMKQVSEEYSRKVFEHPSSGLVSLYHRLQRMNDEI